MTRDEKGYVQFRCDWEPGPPPAGEDVCRLIQWRDRLHGLGMIGVYPDGIGYGNISCRGAGEAGFRISGTATGGLPAFGPEHVTAVTAFDTAGNWLRCRGPVRASSESLSHAAVYRSDPSAAAVIHVHHLGLWEQLRRKIATTAEEAEAGTPGMAAAIEDLFRLPRPPEGLFVMGGHREGLMAYGRTLDEAGERMLAAFASAGS